jgi:alkylation response protein AidB-like acyl-CoA dehydrogenase
MTSAIEPDPERFRTDLRAWLRSRPELAIDPETSGRSAEELDEATLERGRRFQRDLWEAGYAGISWPTEVGGRGLDPGFEAIYRQESAAFEMPTFMFNVGLGMCGPTILAHGTPEQQSRFLPPLLRGEELWAQLFSEPGAGSDLAAVTTRARRVDGGWRLSGQKVWTSSGRFANFGLALVRTHRSRPKHEGMTMFVVDMRAPGVEVRPLRQMTGHAKFDEVFLDEVPAADEQLVGFLNAGWTCARTTLTAERGAVGRNTAQRGGSFLVLLDAARKSGKDRDPHIRQRLVQIYAAERINSWMAARARDAGPGRGHPAGAVAKLHSSSLITAASRLGVDINGPSAVSWDSGGDDQWALRLCAAPGLSIGGGTDEIIKNSVGDRILDLPREPVTDRGIPFDQL